jgi:hypothetical protein
MEEALGDHGDPSHSMRIEMMNPMGEAEVRILPSA